MYKQYDEIDAALSAIEELEIRKDSEYNDVVEVMEILHHNNTVGITMEEGKRLKKLGIEIDLEELGNNRIHVGNESMLTETGKTGLYGLAIGALIVVLGFIIRKVFKWFKDGSSSSSGSGSKSNKELEKTVPTMASSPSNMVKLPEVLLTESDAEKFMDYMESFVDYCDDAIKAAAKVEADGKDIPKEVTEEFLKDLRDALKDIKYDAKGNTFAELAEEVKNTAPRDLPYGKISTVEVFINDIPIAIDKSLISKYENTEKSLKALEKKKADSIANLKLTKEIAKVMTAVFSKNFVRIMAIIRHHTTYLDKTTELYAKAFNNDVLVAAANHKILGPYFKNVDFSDHDSVTRAYDAVIKAGKDTGHPFLHFYKKIGEEAKDFEKKVDSILSGGSSSDKKEKK